MKNLLAAASALLLIGNAALAQTATDTAAQPMGTSPPGTSSETRTSHVQDAYGDTRDTKSSVVQDSQGVTKDSQTTTTVAAPPPPPATTTTTTQTQTTSGPR